MSFIHPIQLCPPQTHPFDTPTCIPWEVCHPNLILGRSPPLKEACVVVYGGQQESEWWEAPLREATIPTTKCLVDILGSWKTWNYGYANLRNLFALYNGLGLMITRHMACIWGIIDFSYVTRCCDSVHLEPTHVLFIYLFKVRNPLSWKVWQ